MKKYLILCFILSFSLLKAQYTQIPDPNFEQALIDLGYDDVIDGQFLTANAQGVLTLNVDEKDINDLTGIEAFVDLDQLFAYGNNISSFDLSALPETLWTLDLGNNNLVDIDLTPIPNIVNLYLESNFFTQIDASNLTSLFIFHVSSQNLTSLNVTGCSNLFSLGCVETSLQSLDLSTCTNLSFLNCHDSDLNLLDFSNNFEIVEIQCYNNPITNINLPHNPNLELLFTGNTQLTSIDLTNCPGLIDLRMGNNNISQLDLSNNLMLVHFSCNGCQMNSLDISNNINLTEVWCRDNNISGSIDFSNNSVLDDIDFRNNLLEDLDFSQNTQVTFVSVDDNPNLQIVNMQNGFNENLIAFIAIDCPQLSCLVVDDPSAPNDNIFIDSHTTLVGSIEDCDDLSVNDQQFIEISIYPNPIKDILIIENTSNIEITSVKLYDILGRLVLQEYNQFDQISVSSLNSGVFFVHIETDQGTITKKVIKE